jgi:hypothetical protein
MRIMGRLMVFLGIMTGIDMFGMFVGMRDIGWAAGALLSAIAIIAGVALIRRAKPKS